MDSLLIECRVCKALSAEVREYSAKICRLCESLHCDECLNEAGYCTPCSEKMEYSKEEAIPV
jgi:hypothetical protein